LTGAVAAPTALLPMADAHNDLLLGVLHQRERGRPDAFGDFWLPQLRAGGIVLQVLPIFTEEQHLGEGALRRALVMLETARWVADRHRDDVAIVTTGRELRTTIDGGRIALVLAFEGLEPMGGDLDVLEAFHRLGVRIASMTWNRRTQLADGAAEDDTGGRLTRLGVAAVSAMERMGMILDVSHLSDPGLAHVRSIARRPFIASHSSCRALQAHPRNLPDDALRAIATAGGFVGLNGYGRFLGHEATVDDYVRHIEHAVGLMGADHVGLGLDFVDDLFALMDPVLSGALIDGHPATVAGLQRPADLAALGPLLVTRLGGDDARRVAAGTMVGILGELLG
jgi:membrane dipeptidase